MADAAHCSFCSRIDPSVTVICDGRCLMCNRCQSSHDIRRLLISVCDEGINNNSNKHNDLQYATNVFCPLCELELVPSMLANIKSFRKERSGNSNFNKNNNSLSSSNTKKLGISKLALHIIIKRYLNNNDEKVEKLLSKNLPTLVESTVTISSLTPLTTLSLFCESIIEIWSDYCSNRLEPLTITIVRMINKRKTTLTNKEFRMKNLLDYLKLTNYEIDSHMIKTEPDLATSIQTGLYLFGYLTGMKPNSNNNYIRTSHSILATTLLVFLSNDSCFKRGCILSTNNEPTVADVKNKFGSRFIFRPISLRLVIKALKYLIMNDEPYWTCAALKPECTEYGLQMPWTNESISKLLKLILTCSTNRIKRGGNATSRTANNTIVNARMKTALMRAEATWGLICDLNKKGFDDMNLLTDKKINDDITLTNCNSNNINDPNNTPGSRLNSRQPEVDISNPDVTFDDNESNNIDNTTNDNNIRNYYSKKDHELLKQTHLALNSDNNIDDNNHILTFDAALNHASNSTADVYLVVMTAISAWECELTYIQDKLRKAKISSMRRKAIKGTYQSSFAELSIPEHHSMNRLIKFYKQKNIERVLYEREMDREKERMKQKEEELQKQVLEKQAAKDARQQARQQRQSGNNNNTNNNNTNTLSKNDDNNKSQLNEKDSNNCDTNGILQDKEKKEKLKKLMDEKWQHERQSTVFVDWNEVREMKLNRQFTFSIPTTLMNKSDAELNYHFYKILHSKNISESFSQVEEEWNEFGMVDMDLLPLYGLPNNIDYINMTTQSANKSISDSNLKDSNDIPTSAVIFHPQPEEYENEIKDINKFRVDEDTGMNYDDNHSDNRHSLQYSRIFNRLSSQLRVSAPTLSRVKSTALINSDDNKILPNINFDDSLRIIGVAERKRIEDKKIKSESHTDGFGSINSTSKTSYNINKLKNDVEMDKVTSSLPGLSSISNIALLPGVRWEHQSPSDISALKLSLLSASVDNNSSSSTPTSLNSNSISQNISDIILNIKNHGYHLDQTQKKHVETELIQSENRNSNVNFIDIMDSKLDGSDVFTKTGLLEPLKASDKWDDNQFDEIYNSINQYHKGNLRNKESTHRSAQIGANKLNIDVGYLKNKRSLVSSASEDNLFSTYDRFEDNNLAYTSDFNRNNYNNNLSVLELAKDEGLLDVSDVLKIDTELNVSERARHRLLRGVTSWQESSLNFKKSINSNNNMMNKLTYMPSLLEREIAPVGNQSRKKIDLSHYANIRPNEIPHIIDEGVECIILRDAKIGESQKNMNNLKQLLSKMFNLTQMNKVKLLDISGNSFAYKDAEVLCESMSCSNGMQQLIEFLARNNKLRDLGTAKLLENILGCNKDHCLKKIDISNNAINFNCGKVVKTLALFKNLIILDLSWNEITLVNNIQVVELTDCLKKLQTLEILSLAYNRIQDKGAIILLETCNNFMKNLKVLDISYCFITSLTIPSLLTYIESSKVLTNNDDCIESKSDAIQSSLEVLLLFGAIFLPEEKETLNLISNNSDVKIFNSGHYNGIDIIEDYYTYPALNILPSEWLQYRKEQQPVRENEDDDSTATSTTSNTT